MLVFHQSEVLLRFFLSFRDACNGNGGHFTSRFVSGDDNDFVVGLLLQTGTNRGQEDVHGGFFPVEGGIQFRDGELLLIVRGREGFTRLWENGQKKRDEKHGQREAGEYEGCH